MRLFRRKDMRTLRTQHGLSQQALADEVGVHRARISEWERGIYTTLPTIEQIEAISYLLGANPFPADTVTVVRWKGR